MKNVPGGHNLFVQVGVYSPVRRPGVPVLGGFPRFYAVNSLCIVQFNKNATGTITVIGYVRYHNIKSYLTLNVKHFKMLLFERCTHIFFVVS